MDTATCHLSRCVVEGKSLLKKSLHSQFLMDEKLRTCLRKEYETGKLLSAETPYVVRYYQLIDTQEECAILMDFVDGLTLDAFILAQPLCFSDEARLDAFMRQLLDALKVIHHAQVVHLDIKPTNLLLTSVNSDLRIIDYFYLSTYFWLDRELRCPRADGWNGRGGLSYRHLCGRQNLGIHSKQPR